MERILAFDVAATDHLNLSAESQASTCPSVLLPLIGGAVLEHFGPVDELPHAGRTEIIRAAEFLRNVEIAGPGRLERKEWLGCPDQRLDAAREVSDAVVDIVGVLLLESVRDGVALHGQKRGNGRDGNLNAASSAVGHVSVDGDELVEPQSEIGAVGALNREVGHERRSILRDPGVARHQEVDKDVNVGAAVAGGYGAHKLKGTSKNSPFSGVVDLESG